MAKAASKSSTPKATKPASKTPAPTKPATPPKPARKGPQAKRAVAKKTARTKAKKKAAQIEALAATAEETFNREEVAMASEPEALPADASPEVRNEQGRPLHNVFLHGDIAPMQIVHISPEMAPVSKVGGLADVVFGLAQETAIRGHSTEVILPKYDHMRYDHIFGLSRCFDDLWVPWRDGAVHCSVYFGLVHDRKCFFIEPHSSDRFFERGRFYGEEDDVYRFAFFSRAAMEFLFKSGKRPDIIHCHDWHSGLVPVFQWEIYQHLGMGQCRICYTVHNFKHQGVTGGDILFATGLNRPEYYFAPERLGDNHHEGAINLMKGGIVYANFVTTVSPTHAGEAKAKGFGFGLERTLQTHHMKYGGVANGIDYQTWDPGSDPHIPHHYSADHIDGKYGNKRALRERFLLADNEKPIVAYVGRLDPQKGLELVRHALFFCVNHGAQFVLLGSSPEQAINAYFWHLKGEINDSPDCHIEIGFNEELAHLIYSGADMVLVPSRYEPCGLTQLIGMRYGTIPVVRAIGGLADTVFDKDYSDKPLDQRNGYVFHNDDFGGVESALARAIGCYYQYPEHFRILIGNAMRSDYSWNVPGQHYLNIYNHIRA